MTTDRPPRHRTMPVAQEARTIVLLMEGTLAQHGWDIARARDKNRLRDLWAVIEPEVRRHILLLATWPARNTTGSGTDSVAEKYALELAAYAAQWAAEHPNADGASFHLIWHPAHSLASSLAFDRDDPDVSWATALTLLAYGSDPAKDAR
ncbi:hypothetical protein [Streptomyces violascens]|uniref:Uncharacterized protein n=1 Tax=Streptomyces violascens TaxID=67381 RepID=A0ABQ3QVB1_9ACTN|nr:hypothetical protein [Streptomyces violascens]GGU26484.1 hypothetical protein GCM10010289_54750 [Streptomyces violascens]GHI41212.1 hypothetical protein Sviol_56200 [Streptomyces violascens]